MIRTTNMYDHDWDERNGCSISLLLDKSEVKEYLDTDKVLRTIPAGFEAPELEDSTFSSPSPARGAFRRQGARGLLKLKLI